MGAAREQAKATQTLKGVAMLREAMARQGLTITVAGARLGVHGNVVSKWATGWGCPTRVQKLRLSKVFGIPPEAWSQLADE